MGSFYERVVHFTFQAGTCCLGIGLIGWALLGLQLSSRRRLALNPRSICLRDVHGLVRFEHLAWHWIHTSLGLDWWNSSEFVGTENII